MYAENLNEETTTGPLGAGDKIGIIDEMYDQLNKERTLARDYPC